jgi:hypothetical protein
MIIRLIAKSRSIEINDPKNFRAFSVRTDDGAGRTAVNLGFGRVVESAGRR